MIVHLHIMKNGGSTFNEILERNFGEGLVRWYPDDNSAFKTTAEEMDAFVRAHSDAQAMASHKLRYPLPPLPGVEYRYVTFLRHPVERAVSLYFHERLRYPPGSGHRSELPIDEYLLQLRRTGWFGNWQCRQLHLSAELEKAKEALASCACVGLVERYDASLVLAAYSLGLPRRTLVQLRMNVSKKGSARDHLPPALYDEYSRLESPDMALYRYGEELFERALRAMNQRFYFDMGLVRLGNGALYAQNRATSLVRGKFQGAGRRAKRVLGAGKP
jgi:hypothetical protein